MKMKLHNQYQQSNYFSSSISERQNFGFRVSTVQTKTDHKHNRHGKEKEHASRCKNNVLKPHNDINNTFLSTGIKKMNQFFHIYLS